MSKLEIDMLQVQIRELQKEVAMAMQGIGQMIAELHRRVEGLEMDLDKEIEARVGLPADSNQDRNSGVEL